jgi:hypothetical protein
VKTISTLGDAPVFLVLGLLLSDLPMLSAMGWLLVFVLAFLISRLAHEQDLVDSVKRSMN